MRLMVVIAVLMCCGCTWTSLVTTQHQFDAEDAKFNIEVMYGIDLEKIIPGDIWTGFDNEAKERIIMVALQAIAKAAPDSMEVHFTQEQTTDAETRAEIESRIRAQVAKELSEANMGDNDTE